jgi:hypothetical protein
MKKGKVIYILFIGLALALSGCGEKSSSKSKSVTTIPVDVTQVDLPDYVFDGGSSSDSIRITLINLHPDLAEIYRGIDMELSMGTVIGNHNDLDANQAGDIVLHKMGRDGSRTQSFFTSGGTTYEDVRENYWYYNTDGKLVWRGAFEGPTGTLVVVVDGVYKSGDGNDPYDYMSGSLWYMPWPIVEGAVSTAGGCYVKDGRLDCKNPSGPLTRCWDVSIGPYDCRFDVSGDSKNVTALGNEYTENQYYKIAEFINLSRENTFKESY